MIRSDGLSFAYSGYQVLADLTLSLHEGQFTTILGPNGAGKSTLLKLLGGILKPSQGSVLYNNINIADMTKRELARIAAYIPQEVHLSFPFTVKEVVTMGRHPYQAGWRSETKEDLKAVNEALEKVQCTHLRNRVFNELSGGEKQLVLVASALAQDPQVLLLDEPAAALDIYHQIRIYKILKELARHQNLTIVVITHQINQALNNADRILILHKGKIEMDNTPDLVIKSKVFNEIFLVKGETIFQDKKKRWYFIAQDIVE